ncbi:hypothetical protein WDU94_009856 [Cyamophila willieti]
MSIYISPNVDIQIFADFVDKIRDCLIEHNQMEWLVCGDFNAKATEWGSAFTDDRGDILTETMATMGLCLVNDGKVPTFERRGQISYIDITLCSNNTMNITQDWKVEENEESGSDHKYLTFKINLESGNQRSRRSGEEERVQIVGWKFSNEFSEALKNKFGELCTGEEILGPEELVEKIKESCNETLPKRMSGNRGRQSVYWWNNIIRDKRKQCIKLRRKKTKLRKRNLCTEEIYDEYNNAMKELRKEIKNAKEKAWKELCDDIDKDVWGMGYKLATKKICKRPPKIASDLEARILDSLFPTVDDITWDQVQIPPQDIPPFTPDELGEALLKMKNGKAPGPDQITPEILKCIGISHPTILLNTFNKLLETGHFPKIWKSARVVLLPKPGKAPLDPTGYRPLSLLDTMGKLFESLINKRIQGCLNLSPEQYGFRPKRSTVNAIERVYRFADVERTMSRRKRKLCLLITVDVRNAFNSAPWDKIVEAMSKKKIPEYLLRMVKSYFTERVLLTSEGQRPMTAGAPQGSVKGPTLWNALYDGILELEVAEGVLLTAYADDLAVVIKARTAEELEEKASETLYLVSEWMNNHGLSLAPQKTEATLLIGRKRCRPLSISIDNVPVQIQGSVNYLGVILDKRLSFGPHVDYLKIKALNRYTALTKILPRQGGPSCQKRKLLYSVFLSTVVYAARVWSNVLEVKRHEKKLTSIQRKRARSRYVEDTEPYQHQRHKL